MSVGVGSWGVLTRRENDRFAAQAPCAMWCTQTLRVQSIARRSAGPFYRGERPQTYPGTNPVPSASLALLRIKAPERESYKTLRRGHIMPPRVNLSRPQDV